MGGMMTASSVLDAMIQTGNQIDSQWSMYIVVHLGLFWFFFLVHRPLLFVERAIALFAYGAFAYINGNGLLYTYNFLEALRIDMLDRFQSELAGMPQMANALATTSFGDREEFILITHLGAFGVVAMFLLFRNLMIRRFERLYPRYAQTGGGLLD
jgi:hypothetical protein